MEEEKQALGGGHEAIKCHEATKGHEVTTMKNTLSGDYLPYIAFRLAIK